MLNSRQLIMTLSETVIPICDIQLVLSYCKQSWVFGIINSLQQSHLDVNMSGAVLLTIHGQSCNADMTYGTIFLWVNE